MENTLKKYTQTPPQRCTLELLLYNIFQSPSLRVSPGGISNYTQLRILV